MATAVQGSRVSLLHERLPEVASRGFFKLHRGLRQVGDYCCIFAERLQVCSEVTSRSELTAAEGLMEEAQASEIYRSPTRPGKLAAIIGVVALVVVAAAIGIERMTEETPYQRNTRICIEQYNSYIRQAKGDLANGDRLAAINSLVAARAQLHKCEVASASSVSGVMQ